MKKLFFLALLLTLLQTLQARERTQAELTNAALSALQSHAATDRKQSASTLRLNVLRQDAVLTVMGNDTIGFAVLSNDDAWPAVIGYSAEPFHPEVNEGLQWFLTVAGQTMSLGKRYEPVAPSGDFMPAVEPIVQTLWNQSAPYNDQCPPATGGKLCPTGCVATALAQIMYYWKYPVHGTGQGTVSVTADGTGSSITVDFGETTYDWDNMLLDYESNKYTDVQANAVSTLMLHCGVAVSMNYAADASGSNTYEARSGMMTYFNYNPGMNLLFRDFYSTDEWMNRLYTELNAGRPVFYTGVDATQGGHAFVCDGYDADGFVHINWGWGPQGGNGYFDVALLDPQGYSFSSGQTILVGVAPTAVMDYASQIVSYDPMTVTRINKSSLSINGATIYNLTGEPFSGEVALVLDMSDSLTVLKSLSSSDIANSHGIATKSGFVKLPTSSLQDGTYRLFVGSKSTKDKTWQLVRRSDNQTNSYMLTVADGDYTVSPVVDDSWTTGIARVEKPATHASQGVYTLDGRYLGNSTEGLAKGIYVVNGKKIMKQ